MSPEFIPLLPDTAPSSRITRAGTSPACDAPRDTGFAPLLPTGTSPTSRTAHAVAPTAPAHERLPIVTLKRDGDRVTRIQVRCSCGETVELDCVY